LIKRAKGEQGQEQEKTMDITVPEIVKEKIEIEKNTVEKSTAQLIPKKQEELKENKIPKKSSEILEKLKNMF
jgi:hypothetical protein